MLDEGPVFVQMDGAIEAYLAQKLVEGVAIAQDTAHAGERTARGRGKRIEC